MMLEDVNSWEYFRGDKLLKVQDWLISVVHDTNLRLFHSMASPLLDRFDEFEPRRDEDYPADDWVKLISTCWGLAEQIEDYVVEHDLLSDAHEQPEWPTIYDYRDCTFTITNPQRMYETAY